MQTLYVRYCAFFSINPTQNIAVELLLSLATLDQKLSRYVDVTLVFYTLLAHKRGYLDLCSLFTFPTRVIALDEEYLSELTRWEEIANEVQHKTKVDHRCIVRMLADFHILPKDQHRLLIGCDIFFLDLPRELVTFLKQPEKDLKVLYMADTYSFGGTPYRLRYYQSPILEGLLGDFYCLAPGVHLTEDAIKRCLKMIDDWPVGPERWDPKPDLKGTHACEQQAAAILLQPFGGQQLPVSRYSHVDLHGGLAVIHTHAIVDVIQILDLTTKARVKDLVDASSE